VALDALGQGDLLLGAEQRHLANLLEVGAHWIARRRLDREVELGGDRLLVRGLGDGL